MTHALHTIHEDLLNKRIHVALAGVGGNGSQVINMLARLDLAIRALGHEHGLSCTAFDADEVSVANVGRNLWSPSDVGQNKAILAVHRLNAYYGLDFEAVPAHYDGDLSFSASDCDILISCVDTRGAREAMREMIGRGEGPRHYWIDLGNGEASGQVVLGEVESCRRRRWKATGASPRLPFVTDLFPQVSDTSLADTNRDSCSLAISLQSQGLLINDFVARIALQLLYQLLARGQIAHHGAMVNIDTLRMNPIPVSLAAWERLGYRPDVELEEVEFA